MRFRLPLLALATFGLTSRAAALDTVQCTEAHFAAQVARSEGRLLDAEEQLSLCGHPSCPGVLTQECGEWLKEVSREIPSVVVVVEDAREKDIIDFSLKIDGIEHHPSRLGAVRLDPGKHEIVVNAEGFLERRQMIRLRVGEQYRRVRLLMASDSPPEEAKQRPSWPLVLAGTVAVAGAGGLTYFGLSARSAERELEECRPYCSDSRVAVVRARYVASNVSLGIGIAALTAGGLYWSLRPKDGRKPAVGVSLHGGPRLLVSGTF